jgi:DNA-binding transcriptional LysR family regulator
MVPDTCGLTKTTRTLFRKSRLKLTEYSGQAMSYGVLQEWAELGIGSAILPRSKLTPSAQPEISLLDGKAPVYIRYRSLWKDSPSTSPEVKQLVSFLKAAAPTIVQGLAR